MGSRAIFVQQMPRDGEPFSGSHVLLKSMTIGSHSTRREQGFLLGDVVARPRWNRLVARLQAVIEAEAPLGYEDETGFHFGEEERGGFFRLNHVNEAWEGMSI
jgi:hypothetical protein